MVKAWPVTLHPVPPVSDQVPVTEPPVSVVEVVVIVPVTVPVRLRVLPPDCTVYVKGPVTAVVVVLGGKTIEPDCVPPVIGKQVPSVRN